MNEQAGFTLRGRNPDVLTCIANLSNDEVFTPPEFASRMLDTLAAAWAVGNGGANIWADRTVSFLDPCTKSGVYLREITTRLIAGLAQEIPDLQTRVDHILTRQVFGIGITRLTSLLARRSVYCSKHANGEHSVGRSFASDEGNIWFERSEHSWSEGKCSFCGASKEALDRDEGRETHAYAFIHTANIKNRVAELFGGVMQFDVIIGNPPYQLADASNSASASPIYQKFVEQAMALEPRYLTMVTPSRWFVGGKGLDDFRSKMLADRRLRTIVDFIVDKDAFPKINVNGGVNFFLWDRDHKGDCAITTIERGGVAGAPVSRPLSEFGVFIRRNQAVSILRKVRAKGESTFASHVSSRKPFGLPTTFFGAAAKSAAKPIKLHCSGRITWVARSEIPVKTEWIDQWKVLVGRATDGNENYPLPIWDQRGPFIAGPGEACSETYLVASVVGSHAEAERVVAYMRTVFFRFLVSLRKITQDNKADVFAFVPALAMDKSWSDEVLSRRYALSNEDVEFMGTMIREMKFTG
ncbi:Eco57I restriction-modification methylase domain-containing protein [Croceibacterium ferulae]|uniref:Eco57I restriction-modification methylase domain-containing protein n=1 Tax=Croceibacterium ferulae TaxID=1854641 RepID=UPI000EABF227|nr:Eco57I restriction-modification methylase domain-containing protein [Croceibacterium ferulae]